MEPRHDPGGAALGRLRLPRPPHHRLQPHPPERRRLRRLRRLPLHADDRSADRLAGADRRGRGSRGSFEPGFSHKAESGAPGFYSVELHPKRRRPDRGRADGDDAHRLRPLHLPAQPPRERPDRRRRQRPARRRSRRPRRPRRGAKSPAAPAAASSAASARATRSTSPPASAAPSPPRGPGPKAGSNRGAKPPPTPRRPAANPKVDRAGRRLRDLRHPPATAPSTVRVGISFVCVAGARAALRGRKRGPRLRRDPRGGAAALGPGARQNPRQRRQRPRRPHLLHGALPRAARAAHLQRRRRRLHRHGRRRPPRPRPHPVRRLLRLGRLPHRDPAAGADRAAPRLRHGPVAGRRRRTVAAACRAGPTRTGSR